MIAWLLGHLPVSTGTQAAAPLQFNLETSSSYMTNYIRQPQPGTCILKIRLYVLQKTLQCSTLI